MNENATIDPGWAWAPFEPRDDRPWTKRLAAHLYRRAGFAATFEQLSDAVSQSPADVVATLVDVGREPHTFREQSNNLAQAALATGSIERLSAQWLYRMLETPVQLLEKLTLFWHGHFATSDMKVDNVALMQRQNELLRRHAVGDFRKLALEISRDPAMLLYLDSASNRKSHPNENYARELMELFCLGEGQYSEEDIRELARCFTGWEIKRDRFRFNRYQHDTETKTVLGQTGRFGGEQGVSIVLDQPAAARFVAGELVRYFVADDLPSGDQDLIEPLAEQLRRDDFNVAATVQGILASNLFFSEHACGRKIKSPVEHSVGWLRALDGTTDMMALSESLGKLGQSLFRPPSVKGWDGGKRWINSSTLLGRSNLIAKVLDSSKTRFGKQSLHASLAEQGVTPGNFVEQMETLLLAVPLSHASREQIARAVSAKGSNAERRMRNAMHLLCTLPEFQLA